MQTYSQDLRDRVLRALERGGGPTEIARRFEVSRHWVYRVQNRFETDGERSGLQRGGYRKSRVAGMEPTVRGWLTENPGLTLAQICDRLAQQGIVIADNLASLKVTGVREAIEAVGASPRYLPPYSPDLNPIEKLFAKLKTLLRRAAIRTIDALWDYIGTLVDVFTAEECSNDFASCGYVAK